VADFNGDGILDLATANNTAADTVSLLLRQRCRRVWRTGRDGTVRRPRLLRPLWVQAADINRDGNQDLVVGCTFGLAVLPGDGSGGFGAQITLDSGINCTGMTVADPDRDGTLECTRKHGGRIRDLRRQRRRRIRLRPQ